MTNYKLMSDVITKINEITTELNQTVLAIKSINERITAINQGYEQSGRNPDYFYRLQI